ncbi:MAG: hypothetical protein MR051_00900, partial [Lentisphaeria bacterium]|nr:hypothetical protein [Lentisphaeria bacterium]
MSTKISNANIYAPDTLTGFTLPGMTMSNGAVLIDEIVVGGTYRGTSPASPGGSSQVYADITVAGRGSYSGSNLFVGADLTGGSAAEHGGAVYSTGTTYIVGGELHGNDAGGRAGVIYTTGTTYIMPEITVMNNEPVATGTMIYGNTAANLGGVAFATAEFDVLGATFSKNISTGSACGVIYMRSGIIDSSTFDGNTAAKSGGAIGVYSGGTGLVSRKNTYQYNLSRNTEEGGGAIFVQLADLNSTDDRFIGNTAVFNGGALHVYYFPQQQTPQCGTATVTGAEFDRNIANIGGAAAVYGVMNLDNSTFTGNTASASGGALGIIGGTVNIGDKTVFSGNSAATRGGAIYATSHTKNFDEVPQTLDITGDVEFRTATDTVYTDKDTLFFIHDADILLNAGLTAVSGATITNSALVFGNTSAINVSGLIFADDQSSLRFTGTAGVTVSSSDYDDAALYVGTNAAQVNRVTARDAYTLGSLSDNGTTLTYAYGNELVLGSTENLSVMRVTDYADADLTGYLGRVRTDGGSHAVSGMIASGNLGAATGGGAFYAAGGTTAISGSTFADNAVDDSTGLGGAMYIASGATVSLSGSTLTGNLAYRGGAVYSDGTLNICDMVFDGNSGSAGAIWVGANGGKGSLTTLSGTVRLLTASDTIIIAGNGGRLDINDADVTLNTSLSVYGQMNITGAVTIRSTSSGGVISGNNSGIVNISNAELTLANDAAFSFGDSMASYTVTDSELIFANSDTTQVKYFDFSGSGNAVEFAGALVNFSGNPDLTDVAVSVSKDILPGEDSSFTIATGIGNMGPTLTVGETVVTLGVATNIDGGTYTFTRNNGTLSVAQSMRRCEFVSAAPAGTESIVIDGQTIALQNRYDTVEEAEQRLISGGTLAVAELSFGGGIQYYHLADPGTALIVDATAECTNLYFSREGTARDGDLSVAIVNSTMNKGYAIAGGTTGTGAPKPNSITGVIDVLISGSTLNGAFSASASLVDGTLCSGVNYTVINSFIANGLYGGGSSANPTIDGDVSISLTGSTVTGSVTGSRAHSVTGTIAVTLAGSTVGAVNKHDSGKTNVTAPMTLTVTGATNSVIGGTMSDVDDLVIDAGASLTFTTAQDLSGVALTVNGSHGVGTVATGVSAIGNYTVIGDADLFLKLDGTDLVLYEKTADIAGGTTVEGNYKGTGDANLVTGGVVEVAFFGTTQASGSVRTVFTGGTVVNSAIGGALVLAGSSAGLGAVTLDIRDGVSLLGGPSNGGMNYVAGYAYGANASPSARDDAKCLTVDSAVLNLSGSSINGNLYAGAHARRGAWTEVTATTITVTGGIVEKLYGGGWAERYGQSDVGTATVNISGGSINRLYAGGGNGSNA